MVPPVADVAVVVAVVVVVVVVVVVWVTGATVLPTQLNTQEEVPPH